MLLSHEVTVPQELEHLTARLKLGLPTRNERAMVVHKRRPGLAELRPVARRRSTTSAFEHLVDNLAGLESPDTERLARQAIFNDGALTMADMPERARREVPAAEPRRHAVIRTGYSEVRGHRRPRAAAPVAHQPQAGVRWQSAPELDAPKGVMLLGVQGCGKSLAARAAAGIFNVPLLRLDFGSALQQVAWRIGEEPARVAARG